MNDGKVKTIYFYEYLSKHLKKIFQKDYVYDNEVDYNNKITELIIECFPNRLDYAYISETYYYTESLYDNLAIEFYRVIKHEI